MISLNVKVGATRWMDALKALARPLRKGKASASPAASRPEPQTEGERALYQAMGWKKSAWEE